MREPLEVFALDERMNRASGSIPYRSLMWTRRYYEVGEFEMVVPSDVFDPSWKYVYCDERPETGIVQKVEFNDDVTSYAGVDSITVSGFFLECILDRSVFLVEEPVQKVEEIPPPTPYVFLKSWTPEVYYDPVSEKYVYQNSETTLVNEDGVQVDYSYRLEPVKVTNGSSGAPTGVVDKMVAANGYYSSDGKKTVHEVSWDGSDRKYDVTFKTDKGDVLYNPREDDDGNKVISLGFGVTTKQSTNYITQIRNWTFGSRYRVVTVKGPWQRQSVEDVQREGDSVQLAMWWVQKFFGNALQYVEPEIAGTEGKLDITLRTLGDMVRSVLKEQNASCRLFYSFESDVITCEFWRGYDRSQDYSDSEPVSALSAGPVLPEGYTELEYIESTGTQYIDTGSKPGNASRYVVTFSFVELPAPNYGGIATARNSDSVDAMCLYATASGTWRYDFGSETKNFGTADTLKHTIDISSSSVVLDGVAQGTPKAQTFTSQFSTYLFCGNNAGATAAWSKMRLYSCQISSGTVMQRNYVPARRDSDGAVGLYDLVTSAFYGNMGTGAFVAGPEVEYPDPEPEPSPTPSQGERAPWTVFSDTWGTIQGYSASRDDSNYANTCFVLYDYDMPTEWESDGSPKLNPVYDWVEDGSGSARWEMVGWKVPYEHKQGYETVTIGDEDEPVIECWYDIREEKPEFDGDWSRDLYEYDSSAENDGKPTLPAMKDSYDAYSDMQGRGRRYLAENRPVETVLDTGTVITDDYLVNWDLGDRVDFGVSTVGLADVGRIIEVVESYESGTARIDITIGEKATYRRRDR